MKDNYTRRAFVTRVIDGDSLEAEVDLGYHIKISERFRVLGIDTPEMYGSERPYGEIAKEFVTENLLGKEVSIRSHKTDSFRRWLADIFYTNEEGQEINLATELLKRGLAEVYKK